MLVYVWMVRVFALFVLTSFASDLGGLQVDLEKVCCYATKKF